jgi:hypothetical protein
MAPLAFFAAVKVDAPAAFVAPLLLHALYDDLEKPPLKVELHFHDTPRVLNPKHPAQQVFVSHGRSFSPQMQLGNSTLFPEEPLSFLN